MAFFEDIQNSVMVIAPFPLSRFSAAHQSAQLVHCLDMAGLKIDTVSAVNTAYCSKQLHFGPLRRFEPALKQLMQQSHDLTILYPQALGFHNEAGRGWKSHSIEKFRRLRMVAQLAGKKPKIVICYPSGLPVIDKIALFGIIFAARIFRPNAVRLVGKSRRGVLLATKILGKPQSVPDITLAQETLFKLAGNADNIRLTPTWFSKAVANVPADSPKGQDLLGIKAAIAILASLPVPLQNPLPKTNGGRVFDSIDSRENTIPTSRFMLNLRQKFRFETKFQLSNTQGRLALLRWYMRDAPDLTHHPLPMLAPVFDAFKSDCKKRAGLGRVSGLQQPDTRDVILPAYLLSLHRCYPEKYGKISLATNAGRTAFAFQAAIDHGRFQMSSSFLGESLCAYFNGRVGDQDTNITRFELFTAVLGHAPAQTQKCLRAPWHSSDIPIWFIDLAKKGYPLLENFASCSAPDVLPVLTVTGTQSPNTGLGRNQKMSTKALQKIKPSKPVFLHHTNADEIPAQISRNNQSGAFHIGYLLWELDKLPKSHMLAKRCLDEIWVPSRFVQDIYQAAFDLPVTMIGKGFDLPDIAPMDLSFYGVEQGQTVFLSCFDMHSSVARKNPLAAVMAFQAAFPHQQDVRFILKTTPPPQNHWGDPTGQMNSIAKLMARDKRLILDQRMISFKKLMSLIRAADCIVSPHRAEGFGYFPAYALKYGKPVIATDYSGTRDFCTPETAFPVEFKLRDVYQTESIYPVSGAKWAEIDQEKLADTMQNVYADLSFARQRAKNGQALLLDYYSANSLAKRYKHRLSDLNLLAPDLTKNSLKGPIGHEQANQRPADRARNLSPVGKP